MSRRHEFEASARTRAPAEAVWPLVGEAVRWPEWSWLTTAELEREGNPVPDGVGALRHFSRGPGGSREEVVVWEPPHHLAYVTVRGLPVRHYRADVHLLDLAEGGTQVTWRCSVEPLVPGTGRLLRMGLRRLVAGFANGVCRYADAQHGPAPSDAN